MDRRNPGKNPRRKELTASSGAGRPPGLSGQDPVEESLLEFTYRMVAARRRLTETAKAREPQRIP